MMYEIMLLASTFFLGASLGALCISVLWLKSAASIRRNLELLEKEISHAQKTKR